MTIKNPKRKIKGFKEENTDMNKVKYIVACAFFFFILLLNSSCLGYDTEGWRCCEVWKSTF